MQMAGNVNAPRLFLRLFLSLCFEERTVLRVLRMSLVDEDLSEALFTFALCLGDFVS